MNIPFISKITKQKTNYETKNNTIFPYDIFEDAPKCHNLQKDISLLIVADLHGIFERVENRPPVFDNEYDACIILGDCTYDDILNVKRFWGDRPIYGVLGNHDDKQLFVETGVINLNEKVTEIAGLKFAGIEGCLKYKPHQPGYTEKSGAEMIETLGPADILISHSLPLGADERYTSKNNIHSGSKFVAKYVCDKGVPVVICGHNHTHFVKQLPNGTMVCECCHIHNLKIGKDGTVQMAKIL